LRYYLAAVSSGRLTQALGATLLATVLLTVSLVLAVPASEVQPTVDGLEYAQSLSHGFWLVMVAQRVEGGFESVAHHQHCYYEQRDLGICNRLFVSPSGRFALYDRPETALVSFFDAQAAESATAAPKNTGFLWSVTWSESEGLVSFTAGGSSSSAAHAFSFKFPRRPSSGT